MNGRRLLNLAYAALVETHGTKVTDELLAPEEATEERAQTHGATPEAAQGMAAMQGIAARTRG